MERSLQTYNIGKAWLSVIQTYQVCATRYEELLDYFGLTLAQFDALVAIERLGDQALPKNIADTLLVTRGNVTGLLKRMRVANLIERLPHPTDGRASIVQLTRSAQQQLKHAKRATRNFITEQVRPFTDPELESTQNLMQAMHSHLLTMDVQAIAETSTVQETGTP
ncbi:MAG: MarR family transcriptional regulator [Pseudomonadota bacterium]